MLTPSAQAAYASAAKPTIAQGAHPLSPFILSLKPTLVSPQELLDSQSLPALRVNLLAGITAHTAPPDPLPDLALDLTLTPHEIQAQLAEHLRSRSGWSAWSMPLTARAFPKLNIRRPVCYEALRYGAPAHPVISSGAFVPHEPPEDIFAYFDFPDEEEASGEEVIDLSEAEPEPSAQPKRRAHLRLRLPSWNIPSAEFGMRRAIASFVALSFVFVLPLHAMNVVQDLRQAKASLETSGAQAVSLLSEGAQAAFAQDAKSAGSDFRAAGARFNHAKQTLDQLGANANALLSVLPAASRSYASGQALLEAGQELSVAGARLSDGYAAMERELSPTPVSRLNLLRAYLTSTIPHLQNAQAALARASLDAVPDAHRQTLAAVQAGLPALIATLQEFDVFYELAKELLGADGSKRYLLIFQNNTELRPTGGFIGSFAELKIRDGVIERLNVPGGGAYDLQGSLRTNLAAPEPLQLLTARWEFQDGNWFPDFPTSARQLLQFYRDAGGPSVDGVLAVNATFVAELIGLLGPIEMEDYGRTINEENFIFEAQKVVELEYDRQENRPKAFIADVAPKLVERTIEKSSDDFLAVVDFLNAGLSRKDLQLYLEDEALERQVIEHGWGGEMKWTDGDSLMVVDTNLGGGKTDGVIEQTIDLSVEIAHDGTITNTLTVARTHHGIRGLLFTGVNNVDYLRVYVPKGSVLLAADGWRAPDPALFEIPDENSVIDDDLAYGMATASKHPASGTTILEEHGKTVFGNWVQTRPGTTSTVTLRYELPFKLDLLQGGRTLMARAKSLIGIPQTERYTLHVQKQSGVLDRVTRVRVSYPDTLTPLWSSHDPALAQLTNETDANVAILFEPL